MQKLQNKDENIDIKIKGFTKSENLTISGDNLYNTSKSLGEATQTVVSKILQTQLHKNPNKKYILKRAKSIYKNFETISNSNDLALGDINYAERYLNSFDGYCKGAGITKEEGLFLQTTITPGCQTIYSQDSKTNAIRLIHTEENSGDTDLIYRKGYDYKLVKMVLPEKTVTFFAYPGICGWGPAFGIDHTHNFVLTVDDLIIRNTSDEYHIWANAIAFMVMDIANIELINLFLTKLKKVIKLGCLEGYALHCASGNKTTQDMLSIEFSENRIAVVDPQTSFRQKIVAQSNYPRDETIKSSSYFYPPKNLSKWSDSNILDFLEMTGRYERLLKFAKKMWWPKINPHRIIKAGLELLANPYGDLAVFGISKGNTKYYHTGLPSIWTAAHLVGYIDNKGRGFYYIGKFVPKPIPYMRYSLDINDEKYKYADRKLWKLVTRERNKHQRKRLPNNIN